MQIYGLLYVGPMTEQHANLKATAELPIDIYLKCAALSSASARSCGYSYRLITNNAEFLSTRARILGIEDLEFAPYKFTWNVPIGIPFHSAHFKLEVIEAFGHGIFGEHVALVDVDAVICRKLPNLAFNDGIYAYDISDEIFLSFGKKRVEKDLQVVAGRPLTNARWYGGEFIYGSRQAFSHLSFYIRQQWETYLSVIGELHHVGDEMLISSALALANASGMPISRADAFVARWWSSRTFIKYPPLTTMLNRSIMHLPSDKDFLASYSTKDFSGPKFLSKYKKYAFRKSLLRRILSFLRPDGKFSPEI